MYSKQCILNNNFKDVKKNSIMKKKLTFVANSGIVNIILMSVNCSLKSYLKIDLLELLKRV